MSYQGDLITLFACKILLYKEFCAVFSRFPKPVPWASPHVTPLNFLQVSLSREIKQSLANVMVKHTNLSYLVQPALLNEVFFLCLVALIKWSEVLPMEVLLEIRLLV